LLLAGSSFESTRISRGTVPSQTSLRNSVVDAGDDVKVDGEWRMPPKVDIVGDKQPAALRQPARGAGKIRLTITSAPAAAYFRAFEFRQQCTVSCSVIFFSFSSFLFFLFHFSFFFDRFMSGISIVNTCSPRRRSEKLLGCKVPLSRVRSSPALLIAVITQPYLRVCFYSEDRRMAVHCAVNVWAAFCCPRLFHGPR